MFDYWAHYESQPSVSVDFLRVVQFYLHFQWNVTPYDLLSLYFHRGFPSFALDNRIPGHFQVFNRFLLNSRHFHSQEIPNSRTFQEFKDAWEPWNPLRTRLFIGFATLSGNISCIWKSMWINLYISMCQSTTKQDKTWSRTGYCEDSSPEVVLFLSEVF